MVVTEKMENRYIQLRRRLDAKGYRDVLPVDSVPLVEKIFNELIVARDELASTTKKAEYFEKIAKELEEGVAPFKEENVRLIKENSTLRVNLLRAEEKVEEQIAGRSTHAQDLEAENKELKQLINQFVGRVKALEADVKRKSTKILVLQERNIEAQIVGPGGEKLPLPSKKQQMEISGTGQQLCPHCIRIRNFVEYGNRCKEPGAIEYMQLADSRIEALQLQLRHMKKKELELVNAITSMKSKLEGREEEITKLHGLIEVKPGGVPKEPGAAEDGENVPVALRAAQMQLNILQIRNMQLERKLQACIVSDRRGQANLGKLGSKCAIFADYPNYDSMKLQEKVETLEAQLSHCCAEKARLKLLLEECENREKHFNSPRTIVATKEPKDNSKHDFAEKEKSVTKKGKKSEDDVWGGEGYTTGTYGRKLNSTSSQKSKSSHGHSRSPSKGRLSAEKPAEDAGTQRKGKSRGTPAEGLAEDREDISVKHNGYATTATKLTKQGEGREKFAGKVKQVTPSPHETSKKTRAIVLSSDEFSEEEDNINMIELRQDIRGKTSMEAKKDKGVDREELRSKGHPTASSSRAVTSEAKKAAPAASNSTESARSAIGGPTRGQLRKQLPIDVDKRGSQKATSFRTKLIAQARQLSVVSEKLNDQISRQRTKTPKGDVDLDLERLAADKRKGVQTKSKPVVEHVTVHKLNGISKQKEQDIHDLLSEEEEESIHSFDADEVNREDEEDEVTRVPRTILHRNGTAQPNAVVETYRKELQRRQDVIKNLEKRNQELEKELSIAETQASNENSRSEPTENSQNITPSRERDLELEIDKLKSSINNSELEKERMQTELAKKDRKLRKVETELSKNLEEIEGLEAKNQELEQTISDSQKDSNGQEIILEVPHGVARSAEKELTPENGRDGVDTGSLSGRRSTQASADAYDNMSKKSPHSDISMTHLLRPQSRSIQSIENLLFPETMESRPNRGDWLSINSNIESYRQEVRKLRDSMFLKEEEIDSLTRENQELERRLKSSQIRETMRTPSYSFSADQEKQELEREIGSLKFALKAIDKDKDEMRMELDKKDEKLYKLQQEMNRNMDEIGKLQLKLKNAELHLGRSSESSRDQEREVTLQKRQIISLREDLDQMIRERDDARKEIRHITQANAMIDMERRNLNVELESRTRETDDLKRQVQRYVDEVRRIEDVLQRKEEEYEAILEHYKGLSAERSTFELTRSTLERETESIRQEVREALANNNTLRSKLASQDTLTKSYEEEIERLTHQISNLEIQLSNVLDSDKALQTDSAISRDLCMKLENNLSKLRLELANTESSRATTEAENRELQAHVNKLESMITDEREKYGRLEGMISQLRDKEYSLQRSIQDVTAEKQHFESQMTTISTKLDIISDECERYRMRNVQLVTDVDMLQRQLETEKGERDNAVDELRRMQQQLNTSSTNLLLTSALGKSTSPTTSTSYRSPQIEFQFTPSSPDTPLGASTSRVENLERYRSTSFERDEEPSTQ